MRGLPRIMTRVKSIPGDSCHYLRHKVVLLCRRTRARQISFRVVILYRLQFKFKASLGFIAEMVERVLVIRSGNAMAARNLSLPAAASGKDKSQSVIVTTGDDGDHVLEVQRVKQFFSSWLVEKELSSDGGLFLASPVDSLFVLLPFLERSRKRVRQLYAWLRYFSTNVSMTGTSRAASGVLRRRVLLQCRPSLGCTGATRPQAAHRGCLQTPVPHLRL